MPTPPASGRVLIVEDDASIRELLHLHLGLAGFEVEQAADGRTALQRMKADRFELIVLDVMLPGIDGISLCQAVRANGPNTDTPMLMLTARDTEADKIVGLNSGADDYLTKPFGIRELQARVGALLRRHKRAGDRAQPDARRLVLSPDITLDVERREVRVRGEAIELTKQEFDLLHHLAARPGIVHSRAALLQSVWPDDTYVTERTVDTVISRLRKKIEGEAHAPAVILTEWGVGYKLADSR